jgi:DinB superfamily
VSEPSGHSEAFRTELARLRESQRRLDDLRPTVEAGEPWPLAERFGTEPEARWGPPEVLAHVAEMLQYWLGEIERVLASSTQPGPFGRVATDALRIGVIERDRTLPARELFDRIDATVARFERRLPQLSEAQARRRGIHPTRGEMTLPEMLERFVLGHLEDHAAQLEEALA